MNPERVMKNPIQSSLHTTSRKSNLTDGQILTASVTKLFPDQKAEIQIGHEKRIAQLEAPLTIGKRYHFQVSIKDQMVYLKVISEQNDTDIEDNIKTLLEQLNLKTGKREISFVKNLQRDTIPFQKNELLQAFNLINNNKLSKSIEPILKEMIQARLPITKDILLALQAVDQSDFKERLTSMKESLQLAQPNRTNINGTNTNVKIDSAELNKDPFAAIHSKMLSPLINKIKQMSPKVEGVSFASQLNKSISNVTTNQVVDQTLFKQLHNMIQNMTDKPSFIKTQWNETLRPFVIENEALFEQLRSQGALTAKTTFASWKNNWLQFMEQSIQQYTENNHHTAHSMPFQLSKVDLEVAFDNIMKTKLDVRSTVEQFFHHYGKAMFEAITKQEPIKTETFKMIKTFIHNELSPIIPKSINEQLMQSLQQNTTANMRQLVSVLTPLTAASHIQETSQAQMLLGENKLLSLPQIQDLFIQNIKQSTTALGLNYEQTILNLEQANQTETTFKSALLQLIQQQTGTLGDQAKQMLHFINGLQIQSVTEVNQFIHAALQLPGGPLGLDQDMKLEFSGKQKEDGVIDSDFCKIVFYLDLHALKTTVIDMNVQKRNVMVTVLNDHPAAEGFANTFEPLLRKGLNDLAYHLSAIHVKPLTAQEKAMPDLTDKPSESNRFEGVDFRI